jgi:hypothetical protein
MNPPRFTWLLRLWLRLNGWRFCPLTGFWQKRCGGGTTHLTSAAGAVGIEMEKEGGEK